ncbi:MAG TPA: AI-2E family transporter [Bryobacteraceae bacterium]|jgi:predicted PurR-regulated permease PerM|nr:AI-2E family transporter [Bryobacteraceae bacterium]
MGISLRGIGAPAREPNSVHNYALSIIAAGVVIGILYWARPVFITSLAAVIIAFLLEPVVVLLTRLRLPRPLASLVVCVIAATTVYFTGMAIWTQLSGIAKDAPELRRNLTKTLEGTTTTIQHVGDSVSQILGTAARPVGASGATGATATAPPPATGRRRRATPPPLPPTPEPAAIQEVRIHDDRNPVADFVVSRLGTLYQAVLMSSFVPFLVYFMLSWRDHIYKSFLRFFEGPDRLIVARSVTGVSTMARAFVVGNFIIGMLLAALSSVLFAVLHVPFPFLAGALSGFLSLVPYIGLPLGMIPPLLATLAVGTDSTVILFSFLVVILLHLTAMNVFYPKLVGARVHLNPLVVTFSLMFWGFLWDAAGLVLAIPITAGVKAICDNVTGLRSFGRFLGD